MVLVPCEPLIYVGEELDHVCILGKTVAFQSDVKLTVSKMETLVSFCIHAPHPLTLWVVSVIKITDRSPHTSQRCDKWGAILCL